MNVEPLFQNVRTPSWLELRRLLGVGGMGKVFAAFDHRSKELVAVKTLSDFVPQELLCLKNEFRSFANVVHRNLVSQYELVENEGQWFLLMELFEGVDLLRFVRQDAIAGGDPSATPKLPQSKNATVGQTPTGTVSGVVPNASEESATAEGAQPNKRMPLPAESVQRATAVFRQVAMGIEAIHRAGFLHRDIKPSNVLVSANGHAVVLDFGIAVARETAQLSAAESDGKVVGTPVYLAAEVLLGERATTASDWFAFGVMLFEALTGVRPFGAGVNLRGKLDIVPAPVSDGAPHISVELAALVSGLLAADPHKRPGFTEIIRVLGGDANDAAETHSHFETTIVGRNEERATLLSLAEQARLKPRAILLQGRSGVGKSALLAEFVRELEGQGRLVLNGRCYEQELVPYKTIDKVVDALTSALSRQPSWVPTLLPDDAGALTSAFPVLREVFPSAPSSSSSDTAPTDLQRRAINALMAVFQHTARQVPLVVCVDDLQWGDVVGAQVLARLAAPNAAPVLVVGGYRAEDAESTAIAALKDHFVREMGSAPEVMKLEAMSAADSIELARTIAAAANVSAPHVIEWALRESEGQPFFLHELLYAASHDPNISNQTVGRGLLEVVANRITHLADDARQFLEAVCLAGAEVPLSVVTHAVGGQHAARAARQLRVGHFVRTSRREGRELIDTYHDKVREVVQRSIGAAQAKALHARFVAAWLDTPGSGAGRAFLLANHARLAGDEISADLAFTLHRDAAFEAEAQFDSARARDFLLTGQSLLAAQGKALEPQLELRLGDICISANDVTGAKAAFERVLARAPTDAIRGGAHAGLSRVAMTSIDTRGGLNEANRALAALSYPAAESTPLMIVRTVGKWLLTLLRVKTLGPGPQRPDDEQLSQLYAMAARAGYFLFDRSLLMVCALRSYMHLSRMPPSRASAELWATAASAMGSIGLRTLARRFINNARREADSVADPAARAFVSAYSSLAIDMAGEPLEGERVGLAALDDNSKLDVTNFLLCTGGVAWNLVMRGQAARALRLIAIGNRRVAGMGRTPLVVGNTYRIYSAPSYGMVGRPEEGRRELDAFREFLTTRPKEEVFRAISLLGHTALYLHVTLAPEAEIESCLAAHAAYGFQPRRHVQALRQIYIAKAGHRGDQLLADPHNASVLSAAKEAAFQLRSLGKHPTLVLHRELIDIKIRWAQGGDPLEALRVLRRQAEALEAPWVIIETMTAEARWHLLRGQKPDALRLRDEVEKIAVSHGVLGLLRRSQHLADSKIVTKA